MRFTSLSTLVRNTASRRLDRTLGSITRLAQHEAESLDRHVLAVRERLIVARKARGVGELLRNQMDLLPATTARIARDHEVRRQLWRSLVSQVLTNSSSADDRL